MYARTTQVIGSMLLALLAANSASGQRCAASSSSIQPDNLLLVGWFGNSIAVQGAQLVVGAPRTGFSVPDGAVYIFSSIDGSQLLDIPAPTEAGGFGTSVATIGFNILIGSPDIDFGRAYLYGALGGGPIYTLEPTDHASATADFFGATVAMTFDTLAVGSPLNDLVPANEDNRGSVYLYSRTTGDQVGKLFATDGVDGDRMGISLSMSGTTLVAGAPQSINSPTSGAAMVFDTSSMTQIGTLFNDGSTGDVFGGSVAINGDYILVGAPLDNEAGTESGAVYVFDRTTLGLLYKLLPAIDGSLNHFGTSVAVDGTTAVIGEPTDYSAFIFDLSTGQQITRLRPSPVTGLFGETVAINTNGIFVGAPFSDADHGQVFRFDRNPTPCPADFSGDCELNFFDVSQFITAFSTDDPRADINGDGIFNFFDVSAFLGAFSAGCP